MSLEGKPEPGPETRFAAQRWRRRIDWEIYRPSLVLALVVALLLLLLDQALSLLAPPISSLLFPLEPSRDDLHRVAIFALSILATFGLTHYALRLRMRERLHRYMIEKTHDFSVIVNENGVCVYATESVRQVTGLSPAEAIGRSFLDRIPPARQDEARQIFDRVRHADSHTPYRAEMTILHKDGQEIAIELTATNCLDIPEIRGLVVYNRDITHLRRVEQESHDSQQRFRLLFHSMTNPAATLKVTRNAQGDPEDLLLLEANEAARRLVYPRPVKQESITRLLPEMHPLWISQVAAVARGAEPLRFLERSPVFNRDMDISIFRLADDQVAVTIQDVTEQMATLDWVKRQRDLMLALSQAQGLDEALGTALEAVCGLSGMEIGGIYLFDAAGGLRLALSRGLSEAMLRAVSHYGPDDPRTRSILTGTPYVTGYSDLTNLTEIEMREGIQTLLVTPIHHRSRVIGTLNLGTRHLGSIDERSRQVAETIASQIGGVIAIHQAARDLHASGHLLSTTLKSLAEGVIITDTEGVVSFLNPAAEALCGVPEAEASGQPLHQIYVVCDERSREPVNPSIAEILAGRQTHTEGEGLLCSRTANEYIIAHTASAIRSEGDRPLGLVVVFRDLTAQRRIEAHLRQQQKLEALGILASGVAHEINNPTNVVMNNAELLAEVAHEPESIHQCSREILRETHRIAAIVRNLLSFARNEQRAQGRPVAIRNLVEETLALTGKALQRNRVDLHVDLPEELPAVTWRGQQIQQVLINLVNNANDALAEHPASAQKRRELRLSARRVEDSGEGAILLEVANNGPAIDSAIQNRIFDPFFTTKDRDKGTGLGLSISYGIIRDHGGRIEVESTPGEWTCFRVFLPLAVTDTSRDETPNRE